MTIREFNVQSIQFNSNLDVVVSMMDNSGKSFPVSQMEYDNISRKLKIFIERRSKPRELKNESVSDREEFKPDGDYA